MEIPSSSRPPLPKATGPRDLRDTWRPSSAPPKPDRASHSPIEQRANPRTRLRHAVEFSVGEGGRQLGVCRNLSLGGAAIQTAEPAPFGSRGTVFIELDGIDGETPLAGMVRWSRPGVMGAQWETFAECINHALVRTAACGDYAAKSRSRPPSRRVRQSNRYVAR